jgi:hypothetical protein
MTGLTLIGCALTVLLLLPVVVLHGEERPVHDGFYGAIALGGLGYSALLHGPGGGMAAAMTALACLLLLSLAMAALERRWDIRLLAGGHIKLLAAGASWLSVTGALLMLALAAGLFLIGAAILRVRKTTNPRPDMAVVAAVALLSAQLMA